MKRDVSSIRYIVEHELCVGCGVCVANATESGERMQWDRNGFLIPAGVEYENDSESLRLCPFNPYPEADVRTEKEIAEIFLKDAPTRHPRLGHFYNTYVGFSNRFRLTSSSGGIATYVISKLLEEKHVNAVFAVRSASSAACFYEYAVIRTVEEAIAASQTKYYPVTMAKVLGQLKNIDGNVAIVGIGCFIKAIRLFQYYHPEYKEKIAFLIGIICGGMKSAFFAEYLASKAGIKGNRFYKPEFRIKNPQSSAIDYSFGCLDTENSPHILKMQTIGDMWGTGLFKNNACDFCDDVTTELADISLGDAWLHPYNQDGKGNNIIFTRTPLAEKIIRNGILYKELSVEEIPMEKAVLSQQGSFNHRHKALGYRIKRVERTGLVLPPKRHSKEKIPIEFRWVQKQRMGVRKMSLTLWSTYRDAGRFDAVIRRELRKIDLLTRIYHFKRRFYNHIPRK